MSTGTKVKAAIVIGGGIGATMRYELSLLVTDWQNQIFTTFTINMTGAFLLGFVSVMLLHSWSKTTYVGPFVAVGVLGGFTTWSHFIVESDRLIGNDEALVGVVYIAATLLLGFAAATAGAALALIYDRRSRAGDAA